MTICPIEGYSGSSFIRTSLQRRFIRCLIYPTLLYYVDCCRALCQLQYINTYNFTRINDRTNEHDVAESRKNRIILDTFYPVFSSTRNYNLPLINITRNQYYRYLL